MSVLYHYAAFRYCVTKVKLQPKLLCSICEKPMRVSLNLIFSRTLSNFISSQRQQSFPLSPEHYSQTRRRLWGTTKPTDWHKAVSNAEKIVGYPTSFMSLRCLLSDEISNVALHMRSLVGTKHPLLKTARGLVYDGKHSLQTRGLIVLLMSKAAGPGKHMSEDLLEKDEATGICSRQRTLAEITEMIHTANLIHKGVVNLSDIKPEEHGSVKDMETGNKLAVLSGDFLLANASTGLAELNNTKVVEIISSAIGNLMEAEFTGLQDRNGNPILPESVGFSDWLQQTFLSSGCLLAKSCQATMELVGHDENIQKQAFEFGVNMAYAHQLNEDLKPFTRPGEFLEQFSSVSAPVIQFAETHGVASLQPLTSATVSAREIQKIISQISSSSVLRECRAKCNDYGRKAIQALDVFPPSDARLALVNIVQAVME